MEFLRFEHTDWMRDAACKGRTDLFFARGQEPEPERRHREALAKELCAACPVLDECRSYARRHLELGLWGGETEADRAAAGYCSPLSTSREAIRQRGWNTS